MLNQLRWLIAVGLAVITWMTSGSHLVVPAAPRLFGMSAVSDPAAIKAAAGSTAAEVGRHVDVINVYKAWVWNTGLPTTEMAAIVRSGAVPEITWEPWNPNDGSGPTKFSLRSIVDGEWDGYIRRWATAAAAWNGPLYLRFAHEMNGTWYPWAIDVGANSPELYVAAYRHVHRIFQAAKAGNVQWVWSPHVMPDLDVTRLRRAYPGDAFVDVIGLDGYVGRQPDSPNGWNPPDELFGPLVGAVADIAPGRPVWINETGCNVGSSRRAACTAAIIDWVKTTSISAIIWFDLDDNAGHDYRLAPDAETAASARTALRSW